RTRAGAVLEKHVLVERERDQRIRIRAAVLRPDDAHRARAAARDPRQRQPLRDAGGRARIPFGVDDPAPAAVPVLVELFGIAPDLVDLPRLDRADHVQPLAEALAAGNREVPAVAVAERRPAGTEIDLEALELAIDDEV